MKSVPFVLLNRDRGIVVIAVEMGKQENTALTVIADIHDFVFAIKSIQNGSRRLKVEWNEATGVWKRY